MSTTFRLPTHALATAWLNTFTSTGDDPDRPALYRTISAEFYGASAVRLIATDSYMLTIAWCASDGEPEPDLSEAPDHSLVVMDTEQRGKGLMSYLWTATKKDMLHETDLRIVNGEEPSTPSLSDDLARKALIVDTELERLTLPILQGEYPGWRSLLSAWSPKGTERVALAPDLLGRFAKFKHAGPVRFSLNGDTGGVRWEMVPGPELMMAHGLLMPVREGADA